MIFVEARQEEFVQAGCGERRITTTPGWASLFVSWVSLVMVSPLLPAGSPLVSCPGAGMRMQRVCGEDWGLIGEDGLFTSISAARPTALGGLPHIHPPTLLVAAVSRRQLPANHKPLWAVAILSCNMGWLHIGEQCAQKNNNIMSKNHMWLLNH